LGFKNTAREIAEKITEGKAQIQHLGKHTKETIDQELISLDQTKPMFRDEKWLKRTKTIWSAILDKISRNENSIICQLQLRDLERILNQR